MKPYRFRCGALVVAVEADSLDEAKRLLRVALFRSLSGLVVYDCDGVTAALELPPSCAEDPRNWG